MLWTAPAGYPLSMGVSSQSLLVPTRSPPRLPRSIIVHGAHPTSCQGSGGRIGAWNDLD